MPFRFRATRRAYFFAYRHTSSSLLFSSACDSCPNTETGALKVLSATPSGPLRPLRGVGKSCGKDQMPDRVLGPDARVHFGGEGNLAVLREFIAVEMGA